MPLQPWDGTTERRQKAQDHDTLIELVTILSNHVVNFNAHVESDTSNFKELKTTVLNIERCVWVATGVIITVHVFPQVVSFFHVLNKVGGP